jgi:drug/metabolite transporter (DMT)-like permease
VLSKYKYHLWLHLIILIWGFTGVIGKELGLLETTAVTIVFYRMLIGFISLFIVLRLLKHKIRITKKGIFATLGTGLIIAAHWITFFKSIQLSNISLALVFLSTTALFTSFIEPIILKRKYDFKESLMGITIIVGIAIIANTSSDYYLAMILALISALGAAFFSVINGKLVQEHDPKSITIFEMLGGFIGVAIFFTLTGELNTETLSIDLEQFGHLFILGSICTAFAFLVGVELSKHLPIFTMNITINLEPIYAVILGLLFYPKTEVMPPGFYLGATIILGTIFINALFKRKKP